MVTHDPRAARHAIKVRHLDKGQVVDGPAACMENVEGMSDGFLGLMFKNIRRNWIGVAPRVGGDHARLDGDAGLVRSSRFSTGDCREEQDLKAIITERWQIPSRMPYSYAATLTEEEPARTDDSLSARSTR